MDTESFIIHIKTEDFYEDIFYDVEKQFDTSNYSEDDKRPLRRDMNKKKNCFFKDELEEKIMIEFVALRTKIYSYLIHNGSEHRKAKKTKKSVT